MRLIWASLFACLILVARGSAGEKETTSSVGRTVAPFSLPDSADKPWSWNDVAKKKTIVVVFLGTQCPINNAYIPRLIELHKTYGPRDVQVVGINANSHDTPLRVAAHVKEYGIPFPVLKDTANVVADAFGARRTPEAFVLDGKGTILYQGRIDDQIGIGFKRSAPTRNDLVEAIEEVLAGKPVSQPTTPAPGCRIARVIKPKTEGTITFTQHVAGIMQKHCQECHRPGQVGPMPLRTYEDALAWSETIREVIQDRRMPPWHADPKHGQFENDPSLSAAERATLLSWIVQGCVKGPDSELPPAREFSSDWRIGKPDVVFTMLKDFTVPARVDRNGIKYQHFLVPTGFTEDVWVQAAEARPGNRAVVHHILILVFSREQGRGGDPRDGIGNGLLVAFAPGDMPTIYKPGMAKKIPKGSTLIFQMHYTPNGVEQSDRSSVGLVLSKQPPAHQMHTRSVTQRLIRIPPGEANHKVTSVSTFDRDAEVYSLMPHMHLRGKDFEYRAIYPDGRSEVLLSVPHYDFNWQSVYRLRQPLTLPAGSKIECTAHFDNSPDNPNNPDPKKTVTWGDQTWEEMMIGFVDYYYTAKKP